MLCLEFEMIELGLMHYGIEIKIYQEDIIFISQHKYASKILNAFNMLKCKIMASPIESDLKLFKEHASSLVEAKKYQMFVGSLIFLIDTRFDISFSIGVLSRFSNKLQKNN